MHKKEFKETRKFIKQRSKKQLNNLFLDAYLECPLSLDFYADIKFNNKRSMLGFWLDNDIIWYYGYYDELPHALQNLSNLRDEYGMRGLLGKKNS